jgi:ABC-type Fe3+ transport system substrate-binding protein
MGVVAGRTRIILDMSPPREPFGDAAAPRGAPRGWDLLGNVPVPLRHRVRDDLAAVAEGLRTEGGAALKCCFPMGQGGRTPFDRLRYIRALDDYPHMLVSAEHGNAFNRRFYERHVASGAFTSGQPATVDPLFAEMVDPQGVFGVFAVAPFVFLIDHRQLNGLPEPRRWADLKDPIYRDQVVFGGWRRDAASPYTQFNKFFLLCMAKEFGLDGLAKVMANVPSLLHSAQMPRLAGTDSSPGGIYILPWSLADMCPRRGDTEVIWPEDGAFAYPLWMTIKSAQRQSLAPLVEHFHGTALGRYLNDNRYPALCPALAPSLPAGASLKWLGWDFVRHPATAKLILAATQCFLDSRQFAPELRSCA